MKFQKIPKRASRFLKGLKGSVRKNSRIFDTREDVKLEFL
jgi:hypothetical protein